MKTTLVLIISLFLMVLLESRKSHIRKDTEKNTFSFNMKQQKTIEYEFFILCSFLEIPKCKFENMSMLFINFFNILLQFYDKTGILKYMLRDNTNIVVRNTLIIKCLIEIKFYWQRNVEVSIIVCLCTFDVVVLILLTVVFKTFKFLLFHKSFSFV